MKVEKSEKKKQMGLDFIKNLTSKNLFQKP